MSVPEEGGQKKNKILVICPFPEGCAPAQRLKYEQYFDDWRAHGYSVDVSPFMSRRLFDVAWSKGHLTTKILGTIVGTLRRWRDFLRIRRYDLVYVFLWVTPLGTSWSERLVRRLARALIYDIDDNVHLGQQIDDRINPNRLLRYLKGKSKPITLMRTADYVIASSPFLEQTAKELNRKGRAVYITSSVDVDHFRPRSRRLNNPKCVIGWTGTFSSQPFIDAIAPMLRKLGETHQFEFRIVGNFDYAMPGVDLKVVQFEKAREIADLEHFDVGVYPLIDDPFVYGKSGLKAIVYMAMGLPVVGSDIGTTPLVIRDGENGFLVRSESDWLEALKRLIDDPDLRRRMGEQARRDAVAKFSVQAVAGEYLKVIESMTETSRRRPS